jgi:DNA-binding transcriptional MerR regulator
MLRYLEQQGVIRPERGPGGHRHFPPPELALAKAAAAALQAGATIATLSAFRRLADRRVEQARVDPDPLAWFDLVAIARAVDPYTRPAPPAAPPPVPPEPPGPRRPPER